MALADLVTHVVTTFLLLFTLKQEALVVQPVLAVAVPVAMVVETHGTDQLTATPQTLDGAAAAVAAAVHRIGLVRPLTQPALMGATQETLPMGSLVAYTTRLVMAAMVEIHPVVVTKHLLICVGVTQIITLGRIAALVVVGAQALAEKLGALHPYKYLALPVVVAVAVREVEFQLIPEILVMQGIPELTLPIIADR